MSGSKYFVWAESRWRELDVAKGRVEGWSRRPRFVFVQRGRLRVTSRRRVLSALEALASHRPSAVGIGPRLSMRSNEHTMSSRSRLKPLMESPPALPPAPGPCAHHHCCMHSNGCNNNIKPCSVTIKTVPSQLVDAGTQHRAMADAGVQHAPPPLTINLINSSHKPPPDTTKLATTPPKRAPTESRTVKSGNRAPKLDSLLQQNPAKRPRQSDDSSDNFRASKKRSVETEKSKKISKRAERTISVSERSDVCKELTISESDVMALRSFVARTRSPALERFDTDDGYKRALFYAINPLVDVERCAQTERALRERHEMALPHFAARLGLAPQGTTRSTPTRRRRAHVRYRERSFSDNDKENRQAKDNQNKKQTAKKIHKSTTESDYTSEVSTENRRGSLRQKTVPKNIIEDSDVKHDTSEANNNDKRNSLRSRPSIKNVSNEKKTKNDNKETLPQKRNPKHDESDVSETVSESSEKQDQRNITASRSKQITIEDSETSNTDEPNQNKHRRNSLRSRTEQSHKKHARKEKVTSSSDISDSVEEKSSSSYDEKEKATDKLSSLRRRSVPQTNRKSQSDSESDFKTAKKTVSVTKSVDSVPKTQSKSSSNGTPKKNCKSAVNKSDSESIIFKPSKAVKVSKSVSNKTQQVTTQTKTSAGSSTTKEQTNTHIISKRASGNVSKEYSNLEDHAIVSWVSVGSRARLVNGNRLWRELQEAFPRVGGRARSWHSLRNRYLRYILPGLGALHLPPADVSRLRAAAATGEVKSKRGGGAAKSRRNSIFKVSQVRAASTRRPPARAGDPPDDTATTSGAAAEPSPPKAIANDNAHSTSSNTSSSSSSPPTSEDEKEPAPPSQTRRSLRPRTSEAAPTPAPRPAAAPTAPRSRKLFNPKLVL